MRSSLPGNNLIYPSNSSERARTTHTVQYSSDELSNFSTVEVDYRGGDGNVPRTLSNANIKHIGIDTTGDGIINRDLSSSVGTVRINSQGVITIEFTDSVTLPSDSRLLVQYAGVRNPSHESADTVQVSVGDSTQTGTILYGYEGNGTLGNGINLKASTNGPTEIVAPLPFNYISDSNGDMTAALNTDGFSNVQNESLNISMNISRSEGPSNVTVLSNTIEVVAPSANITTKDEINVKADSANISVNGTTNIAPMNNIWVRIQSTQSVPSPWLYHYKTTVTENQTFSVQVPTTDIHNAESIEVSPVSRTAPLSDGKQINISKSVAND
jgi:hypothetical protein